jgi:hypothetical protein
MLTLSERWFTTQASSCGRITVAPPVPLPPPLPPADGSKRTATATGSSPTGTSNRRPRPPFEVISKIESRLSGVFTAKRRGVGSPAFQNASGRTCPLSKL